MAGFINILPSDVEHRIVNFKPNICFPEMIEDLNRVSGMGISVEKNVITINKTLKLSIQVPPCISSDKTMNGVVMTVSRSVC